ncbi:MAG: protein translocase subunit SecF [Candidatus Bipolaricaulota bacterium]|nr:protein translocase subunit SecF [Candidatus Bipolaricaulota bacterium]MDW8126744.1 protein translocase subunit SecF [Candidatus Bipolaricaulota bacterium]
MTQFDFMGKAKFFGLISFVLFLGSILSLVLLGLRPGIDFTGGFQLTLLYPAGVSVDSQTVRTQVEKALSEVGSKASFYLQRISAERAVEGAGQANLEGIVITVRTTEEAVVEKLRQAFVHPENPSIPQPFEYSVTTIGAQISREIVNRAWQAILVALAGMLVYIAIRFRLRYGIAAILALVHDVVLTLGVFSVFRLEINLPVIAALLTVVGYSINDTIIVFDRIRENLRLIKKASLWEVINRSVNQTLTRTINTSSTTLLPIVVLLIVAGIALREFTVAMACGVIFGTYSSIFIASPILYAWTRAAERLRAR